MTNLLAIRKYLRNNDVAVRSANTQNPRPQNQPVSGSCRDISKWLDVKQPHPDKEVAKEIHKEYLKCPNFDKLCVKLETSTTTMYNLFDKHKLERKYPKMPNAPHEIEVPENGTLETEEPAIVEDREKLELRNSENVSSYDIRLNLANSPNVSSYDIVDTGGQR